MYKIKTFCSRCDASLYIRRITIDISPDTIQDTRGHAPHLFMKLRRIFWRCTNIPEYINLGPHAKLSQCAASTYQMRRILPSDRNYKYPKTRRISEDIIYTKYEDHRNLRPNSDDQAAQDTPERRYKSCKKVLNVFNSLSSFVLLCQ